MAGSCLTIEIPSLAEASGRTPAGAAVEARCRVREVCVSVGEHGFIVDLCLLIPGRLEDLGDYHLLLLAPGDAWVGGVVDFTATEFTSALPDWIDETSVAAAGDPVSEVVLLDGPGPWRLGCRPDPMFSVTLAAASFNLRYLTAADPKNWRATWDASELIEEVAGELRVKDGIAAVLGPLKADYYRADGFCYKPWSFRYPVAWGYTLDQVLNFQFTWLAWSESAGKLGQGSFSPGLEALAATSDAAADPDTSAEVYVLGRVDGELKFIDIASYVNTVWGPIPAAT